jgi:hypothetical protein
VDFDCEEAFLHGQGADPTSGGTYHWLNALRKAGRGLARSAAESGSWALGRERRGVETLSGSDRSVMQVGKYIG